MTNKITEILACPVCKGKLLMDPKGKKLLCQFDKLAYPIRDGIPVMIIEEAEKLTQP